MARLFVLFAVILQVSYIYANIDDGEDESPLRSVLKNKPSEENLDNIKEFRATDTEWMDLFVLPKNHNYPATSSAAKMAQVMSSEKTPEEQLEEMKAMANEISRAIQNEMVSLLSYALLDAEKEMNENGLRKKRSAENPIDSTQLVMRLLKHIKYSNENQNIAIEKLMTAQEIADKFGIEFTPDPDIFSDLAIASTKQAEDLSTILEDAYKTKNVSNQIEFVPLNDEPVQSSHENNTYYVYSTEVPEEKITEQLNTPPDFEFVPERIEPQSASETVEQQSVTPPHHEHVPEHVDSQLPNINYFHYEPVEYSFYFINPVETQIPPPPVHNHAPVSYMPKFYEPPMYTPVEHYPHYHPEPITTTTTIILPIEEIAEPEPELVGEEFEETISSKVIVDRGDEPGSATVNHVMTYTVSEKSHFRTPQIENLPQQMQYYFFLM